MAVDLGACTVDVPAGAPPDLVIARVASESDLRVFARLSAANWSPPETEVLRFYELGSSEFLIDDCPMCFYVGYCAGGPVATAELTVGGGVAGLYNISTAAAYRRRGIGAEMVRHTMIDARERGLRTAVLQAAPQGAAVYERVGFTAFGTITEYKPLEA
jgi:ribosomal protein S18 acetylase RimI-like enzyme